MGLGQSCSALGCDSQNCIVLVIFAGPPSTSRPFVRRMASEQERESGQKLIDKTMITIARTQRTSQRHPTLSINEGPDNDRSDQRRRRPNPIDMKPMRARALAFKPGDDVTTETVINPPMEVPIGEQDVEADEAAGISSVSRLNSDHAEGGGGDPQPDHGNFGPEAVDHPALNRSEHDRIRSRVTS